MKYVEFITALVRLASHKIGMAESAFLMCCAGGASVDQLAKILNVDKRIIRGRGGCLKKKDLVWMESQGGYKITYYPTEKGQEIINITLKNINQ